MRDFDFHVPVKILFGKGKIDLLGDELAAYGIKKVLLHYGKSSIFKTGVYDKVVNSLKANNIEFVECGGVVPNPVLTKVQEAIDICKKENVDAIVAAGGGSVVDSAKAVAAGARYDGDVWDFFERKARPTEALPIFTVLTISATATEMNSGAVITNEAEKKKWAFGAGYITMPKVSIIDPSVQMHLPTNQTVNGAVDSMSHVFEQYYDGTDDTDFQDTLSEGLIKTLMKHVKILLKEPTNYESRSQLAWCSTMAHNGVNAVGRNGGDWATHMIEHSVSAYYNIAHGEGLAILFPAWMLYVVRQKPRKFARMAREVFGVTESNDLDAALKGISEFKKFFKEIGAPTTLKEVGVTEDSLPVMAKNAAINAPLGKMKPLNEQDILNIYKIAYE